MSAAADAVLRLRNCTCGELGSQTPTEEETS